MIVLVLQFQCTFVYVCLGSGIQSVVRGSMEESLVQILSPKRRIDVLRDVLSARELGRPYVVTFCGVNGVGKSTNLAKVQCMIKDGFI